MLVSEGIENGRSKSEMFAIEGLNEPHNICMDLIIVVTGDKICNPHRADCVMPGKIFPQDLQRFSNLNLDSHRLQSDNNVLDPGTVVADMVIKIVGVRVFPAILELDQKRTLTKED